MKTKTFVVRDEQAQRIEEVSAASRMSESELMRAALDHVDLVRIAGERRLAELEQLTAAGLARGNAPPASTASAREHLTRHAALCGFESEPSTTGSDADA